MFSRQPKQENAAMLTTAPATDADEIAVLKARVAELEGVVEQRTNRQPHEETEDERLKRLGAVHAAFFGTVREINPWAGYERPSSAPTIIKELPTVTREDYGNRIVYRGELLAFCTPVGQRARDFDGT